MPAPTPAGDDLATGTFPDGAIRVSVGPFNTEDDIDRLAAALAEVAL